MGLVINFVWSSVWRGWQVQSSSGSLCHRWCSVRWRVGWSPGTLDAPFCVVSCPPAACFACPHPFLDSTPPCTAVICYLLPGAWVNVCKFKNALVDILETQCRAACGTVSGCRLPIQHIFWDAAIAHAMHVAEPARPSTAVLVTLSCHYSTCSVCQITVPECNVMCLLVGPSLNYQWNAFFPDIYWCTRVVINWSWIWLAFLAKNLHQYWY